MKLFSRFRKPPPPPSPSAPRSNTAEDPLFALPSKSKIRNPSPVNHDTWIESYSNAHSRFVFTSKSTGKMYDEPPSGAVNVVYSHPTKLKAAAEAEAEALYPAFFGGWALSLPLCGSPDDERDDECEDTAISDITGDSWEDNASM